LSAHGKVATSVLPSPVFISAIIPLCRAMPPMSWTSKWRMPRERTDASRVRAKQSGMMRSSTADFSFSAASAISLRQACICSRMRASSSDFAHASRSLMRATTGRSRLSSRMFLVPMSFLTTKSTMVVLVL
jgi:hypothetical protein